MAVSPTHRGWKYDPENNRLDIRFGEDGATSNTRVGHVNTSGLTMAQTLTSLGLVFSEACAPAATNVYAVRDNCGDLTLNAITGKQINLAIAGTDEVTLSGTALTASGVDLFVGDGQGLVVGHTSQIMAGGVTAEFQVLGTAASDAAITIGRFSSNCSQAGLTFVKSRSGVIGTSTVVQACDDIGSISWVAADGCDFASIAADIRAVVDGTPGANDTPGRLVFSTTADGASSVTERMRIDSAGNMKLGGTAAHACNAGAKILSIFTGTAPAGALASGASFFAACVACTVEMRVMDAGGTASTVS